jgi:hypothetical protein
VWERVDRGRELHFHLAGINNQNFIMRDEETGTWWQQVSGEAIYGPLRGEKLIQVASDEVSYGLWQSENPSGSVLAANKKYEAKYAKADWEQRIGKLPVVVTPRNSALKGRDIVLGVVEGGAARAYPLSVALQQSPIADVLGGVPILIVTGPDGKSVRGFNRKSGNDVLDLYRSTDSKQWALIDTQTAGQWDFRGCRIGRAPVASADTVRQVAQSSDVQQCLEPVPLLKDYWFDWQLYHPQTSVYRH